VSRRAAATAACLVLLVLAACGVPADDDPQAIAARDLPAELLDPDPGSSTSVPESGATTVPVYMLEDSTDGVRLVAVDRRVTEAGTPNERLVQLIGGASADEMEGGITSAIPAATVLLDVTTDEEADEVTIDLSEDFFTIEGEALAQAFAQIVWTATEPEAGGFRQVRFSVDGDPTAVLDGEGNNQEGPVTRASYDEFAPIG